MKGSKYAVIKLVESSNYIDRINALLNGTKAKISVYDNWMPKGIRYDKEAELKNFLKHNFDPKLYDEIVRWWLHVDTTTPNWDLVSTCMIDGKRGILLVEAKAHKDELESHGKDPKKITSEDSARNHIQIGEAINEANERINRTSPGVSISRDKCYQLSNRVAHAWWLANQGIPVILVYLGFLNCKDMDDGKRTLFKDDKDWQNCFTKHAEQVGVNGIIGKQIRCGESGFKLIVKSM